MSEGTARLSRADDIELRYRALFETMGPAVLLMRGSACIDCNPATLELFGVDSREEMLGKTPLDFAPPVQPNGQSSVELVGQHVLLALERGTHTFEWLSARKSGEPILLEVRFTPCGPREENFFLCIAVDISERRRAEEALRASEQRFRAIVENATEAMGVADLETGRLRFVNPALCALLGYRADELLGMSVLALHPDEVQAHAMARFASLEEGTRGESVVTLRRKDGSTLEASGRGARLELDGRPCVAGLFWDLTERRLTEAERLKAQKLEALGVLAGGIAHDFNNLLQGIAAGISAAKISRTPDQARELLGNAEEALQMAARLTSQLLTFARGGAPLKRAVALGPLVLRTGRAAVAGSRAHCEFDLAADLAQVEIDEGQLEQVVQNLVLNAVQAMGGGGTVRVAARNVQAPGPAAKDLTCGPSVAISVEDSGAGIPQALLSRIFDPYFTTRSNGSGLGLATAHSVVRRHGGFIDVKSTVGKGTTFTVFLPATTAVARAPVAAASPARRSSRLLWMDDEPHLRSITSQLLELLGHQVETAADGTEAIERYRAARAAGRPFDLVVLDLTVRGGMGGLEALGHLREIDPEVRVVVCSGYSDDAAMAEHRAHGFSGVLRKPSTLEELETAIAEQLAPRPAP